MPVHMQDSNAGSDNRKPLGCCFGVCRKLNHESCAFSWAHRSSVRAAGAGKGWVGFSWAGGACAQGGEGRREEQRELGWKLEDKDELAHGGHEGPALQRYAMGLEPSLFTEMEWKGKFSAQVSCAFSKAMGRRCSVSGYKANKTRRSWCWCFHADSGICINKLRESSNQMVNTHKCPQPLSSGKWLFNLNCKCNLSNTVC